MIKVESERRLGVVISYLGQIVQIATGLIYTPIMLRLLGQSEYGLYQLVYSVVSYLGLLSLGFGSSYMRFYAREKAKNNDEGIRKLNGMFLLIFLAISGICIICGIVMVSNIKSIFAQGLNEKEYDTAKILMLIMIVNLALTFPNSVFNCIITSQEKFLFQKTVILLQYLLNPFLTLPLLLQGYGSVSMVAVTTALTFGVLVTNIYYCLVKIHAKFTFRGLQIGLLNEMWVFTFFIFLNQIVDQINWSVDKYLLGRIVGTTAVAIYGVGGQINNLYLQLSTSVSNVFVPKVNRIVAETGDNKELTVLFTRVGRIQFIIMASVLTGFVFFGKEFIKLWAGIGYSESYYIALLLIVPVTVPLIQNLGIEIQRAKNKHKARSIVYFFISIANIFISIPLIHNWGPIGAAVGTNISLLFGNIIFMNWYYNNRLGINIRYYWKHIVQLAPALVLPCLFGAFSLFVIKPKGLLALIISALIFAAIYCLSMYLFGLNEEEKRLLQLPFRRKSEK